MSFTAFVHCTNLRLLNSEVQDGGIGINFEQVHATRTCPSQELEQHIITSYQFFTDSYLTTYSELFV